MSEKSKFRNKRGSFLKICTHCGNQLLLGKNWTAGNKKKYRYVCISCDRKARKQYRREIGRYNTLKYKGKTIKVDPVKLGRKDYCEICSRSLRKKKSMMHHFIYDDEHPWRHTVTLCYNCHKLVHLRDDRGLQKKFGDIENWCKKYVDVRESVFFKERIAKGFNTEVNKDKGVERC